MELERQIVELGIPYTGWPIRSHHDYAFGQDLLSLDLRRRIEDWAKFFNMHFDDEEGWDSSANLRVYSSTGGQLQRAVQAELGAGFLVELRSPLGASSTP